MSEQLELDLARPREPLAERLRCAGRTLSCWTPVWIPLVLLGQVLTLGLLPAYRESRRLAQAENAVSGRAAHLTAEERKLSTQAEMLVDPVYRERVRRSLLDPNATPLTLERARSAPPP
jgi:hypothetical protein